MGLDPGCYHRGPVKGPVASVATQFNWQDPSLSTESIIIKKPSACISVLGVAGSSHGYGTLCCDLKQNQTLMGLENVHQWNLSSI